MMNPKSWGRAQAAWDYIWSCVNRSVRIPYGWWLSGEVPSEDPAWADNAPPPDPDYIDTCFCAGVGNLMIRALEMFDEGYVIPGLGNLLYDGGTVGWKGYYESYGTLDYFELDFALAHPGTVMLREFRDASSDQGHWAVTAYYEGDGQMYALQTFPPDGLNWTYTVEQSHDGGYYEYMVKPWNWLPITEEEYYAGKGEPVGKVEGSELTIEHVAQIMPNARANGLDNEWEALVKTLYDYEINTKNRIAAFLMNVAKESGELYYLEEIADGSDYEWRSDLGNVYAGDGPRFKGHGYIQITGRNNHRVVGEALGVDAVTYPTVLATLPYAWFSAGYYWCCMSSWGNLNEIADTGDYETTILGVRGGPDSDRLHYWATAMEVLPDDVVLPGQVATIPSTPAPSSDLDPVSRKWGYYRYAGDDDWNLVYVPAPKVEE